MARAPAAAVIPNGELRSLTGIRALASWWVVLYHLGGTSELRALAPLTAGGYLGVDLFFLLSGFIISYRYAVELRPFARRTYAHFLWLRLARIYPVHLATLVALATVVGLARLAGLHLASPEDFTLPLFLRHLALAQVPIWRDAQQATHLSWNYPAWSISAEFLAYLAFPAVLWMLRPIQRPWHGAVCSLLLLVTLPPAMAHLRFGAEILRVMVEFSTGCCIFLAFDQGWWRALPWKRIGPAALTCGLVIGTAAPREWGVGYLAVPALAMTLLALAHSELAAGHGALSWVASSPAVAWGRWSYSLYMTHYPTMLIMGTVFARLPIGAGIARSTAFLIVHVVAMAAAAVLCYRLVEQPGRHAMRHVPALFVQRRAVALTPI